MRRALTIAAFVLCLCGAVVVPVYAVTINGGVGDDDIVGRENESDNLNGGPGCDDVKGLGQPDDISGGNGGCDHARGGDGWNDKVVTWDDNQGGDDAYGGAGENDVCKVDMNDNADNSCDEIRF